MAINRDLFFASIRRVLFKGSLSVGQVDGVSKILDEWERRGLTDLRWFAYILATAFHETGHTMQPVREDGGEDYLRSKAYYPWVGEGLVQVTWEVNHRKFGATAPGQLMSWPIALRALFDGMIDGVFTGKKLADYFSAKKTDWLHARQIVNGMDRASAIAAYAQGFHDALRPAWVSAPAKLAIVKPVTGAVAAVVAGSAAAAGALNHWHVGPAAWTVALVAIAVVAGLVLMAVLKPAPKGAAARPPAAKPMAPQPASAPPSAVGSVAPLDAAMADLTAAGAAWDAALARIAKARADVRANAAALLVADRAAEDKVAALKAAAEPTAAPAAEAPGWAEQMAQVDWTTVLAPQDAAEVTAWLAAAKEADDKAATTPPAAPAAAVQVAA